MNACFLEFHNNNCGGGVAKCVRVCYLGREVQYNEIVLCNLINVCVSLNTEARYLP